MSPEPAPDAINPYAAPQSAAGTQAHVFTEAYRKRLTAFIGYVTLAIALGVPTGLIICMDRLDFAERAHWLAAFLGVGITILVIRAALNYVSIWGFPGMGRRLAEILQSEGIDPDAWDGVFVQFAPSDRPRVYENCTNWDVGFLFLLGDRLVYLGDHARFALRRTDIVRQWLGPSSPHSWHPANVYLSWRDDASGASGAFNVGLGNCRSLRQARRDTPAFAERIKAWREDEGGSPPAAPEWAQLGPPKFADVPSQSIREAAGFSKLAAGIVAMCVTSLGVGWLLNAISELWRLNSTPDFWRDGAYIAASAAISLIILHAPTAAYREPSAR